MSAPIVLFVYKRLAQVRRTVEALKENQLAASSDLFIYSDGARNEDDQKQITEVRSYLSTIAGFKSISVIASEINKGLAVSIVKGVTDIVNQYGRVIVLEDDIVTSPYFLKFMNDALDMYASDPAVMSVSGYMYPHRRPLPETFFFNVPLCWGWATWKDAWSHYNDSASFYIDYLNKTKRWKEFNKFGGKYLERQLRKNATGAMHTWFIYWHASVFYHTGFSLFPSRTLIDNTGFDNSGEHGASTNKYYSPMSAIPVKVERIPLVESTDAVRVVKGFYLFKANPLFNAIKKRLKRIFN